MSSSVSCVIGFPNRLYQLRLLFLIFIQLVKIGAFFSPNKFFHVCKYPDDLFQPSLWASPHQVPCQCVSYQFLNFLHKFFLSLLFQLIGEALLVRTQLGLLDGKQAELPDEIMSLIQCLSVKLFITACSCLQCFKAAI